MTEERFEELEQAILNTFAYDEKYCGVEDAKSTISEIVGEKCRCYDSYIDDGCEGEDTYVMCDAFECGELTIHIYYGNNTRLIGFADVYEG